MSYATGDAANMAAVKTALVNACTGDGWTDNTDAEGKTVLSKSGCYVRIESGIDEASNPCLELLGRTSLDGGDAPNVVSMRTMGIVGISFPLTYHVFTFSDIEVFMVINYGSSFYQWCAFGQSNMSGLPGSGNWVGASIGSNIPNNNGAIYITPTTGGGGTYSSHDFTSAALFWGTNFKSSYGETRNCWLHNAIEASYPWSFALGSNFGSTMVGPTYMTELLNTQPNTMTGESTFLPIRAYKLRESSKCSQLVEVTNARHVRCDNLLNRQIITLGSDQWMVFPWYRRNVSERDGGLAITHTGTFGWAIKYDV
jgi:hypothetical protein